MADEEKLILNVGLACLDIVMIVNSYPEEDSDQRCKSCEWRTGGNAANNSILMKEFCVPCEYFGTISSDYGGKYLKENFENAGINCKNCVFYDDCECPTSVILINSLNGSRTIMHSNKNLPELCFEDFKKLDLSKYKWIHFEGRRSLSEIMKMIKYIKERNEHVLQPITISLELEKPEPFYIECISCDADVIFISKDLARVCGYLDMESAVKNLSKKLMPGRILICPWGEEGACGWSSDSSLIKSASFSPVKLVDTLGAGDTFVATTIISMSRGKSLQNSIVDGCRVAGAKCGMEGIKDLKKVVLYI